jgi:hypothetical protein
MKRRRTKDRRSSILNPLLALALAAAALGGAGPAHAEVKTWVGGSNFWDLAGAWNPAGVPGSGDTVVIAGVSSHVLLTNATTIEALWVTNGATLTFSNLDAVVEATTVTISSGATVSHVINSDTNETDGWQVDGRVYIVCSNFTLASDGAINVDYKGFQPIGYIRGAGPGGGSMSVGGQNPGGAGYGAAGGNGGRPGGPAYGSTNAPEWPGSAGGGSYNYSMVGSAGGGLVWIFATNATINGTISANGKNGYTVIDGTGGGSGGGIYIRCGTLSGNGTIRANGGTGGNYAGGGAGGRIALVYDTLSWNGIVQANGANGAPNLGYPPTCAGGIGSLYASSTEIVQPVLNASGYRLFAPVSDLYFDSFTLTNGARLACSLPNVRLFVTNDLAIYGSGSRLDLGGSAGDTPRTLLSVGGNLRVSGGSLILRSGITNQVADDDQELVRVNGAVVVTNGGTIIPYSYQFPPLRTNAGGSVRFEVGNLLVASGATINAKGTGFAGDREGYGNQGGFGPGGAPGYWNTGGAGHGGPGGQGGQKPGGASYGSSNAPVLPGSGGGYTKHGSGPWQGGNGGGLVRFKANGTIQIDGIINADATDPGSFDGGGSGGGVYLYCHTFKGAGTITAKGSKAGTYCGAGAGGRIAVWYRKNEWTGSLSYPDSVAPGTPYGSGYIPLASTGTVVWVELPPSGTLILIK